MVCTWHTETDLLCQASRNDIIAKIFRLLFTAKNLCNAQGHSSLAKNFLLRRGA